jgi:hypothetical protein
MKQKKNSKLSLSKATVANLNIPQMKKAVGGIETETCPSLCLGTCKPIQCNTSLECPTPVTDEYTWCQCPTVTC